MIVNLATGGSADDEIYQQLRSELLAIPDLAKETPEFVRKYRSVDQLWGFIKYADSSYKGRRLMIWDAFDPLLSKLESEAFNPIQKNVALTLSTFDPDAIYQMWQKATERSQHDPEGAITAARTLLESVCKHILEDRRVSYPEDADLPKLYYMVATELKVAPNQHTERVFKEILGGCNAVVNGLGALRNRLSDAHGGGKSRVRPSTRHAHLAVALSGAMAMFLVETLNARNLEPA